MPTGLATLEMAVLDWGTGHATTIVSVSPDAFSVPSVTPVSVVTGTPSHGRPVPTE